MSPTPPFQRLSKLGRGGTSEVDLVEDSLGQKFAYKGIRPEAWNYLGKEVDAIQKLCHPNVVRVIDYIAPSAVVPGRYPNLPGIFFEYIKGKSLFDVLQKGGVHANNVWPLLEQVASAIDHAHVRRIVHRDIKTLNILIPDDGSPVKLIDFGGAAHLMGGSLAPETRFHATPEYVAPEVVSGRNQPQQPNDIYAFAVVIHECLTGKLPLPFRAARRQREGTSYAKWWTDIAEFVPVVRHSTIPRRAWEVLARSLSRNPEQRHESASQLVFELQRAIRRHGDEKLYLKRAITDGNDRKRETLHYVAASKLLYPVVSANGVEMEFTLGETTSARPRRIVFLKDGSVMRLISLRGEPFPIGWDKDDEFRTGDNGPARIVRLSDFYIDACLVTNRQFLKFVLDPGCRLKSPLELPWFQHYTIGQNDDHPVRDVTHAEAAAYCEWAGKELPTECQWECAARAANPSFVYPWGKSISFPGVDDESAMLQRRAHCGNSHDRGPVDVGGFEPNLLGLYDMAGNVAEWVRDSYFANGYNAFLPRNGTVPLNLVNDRKSASTVIRGGCWQDGGESVSSVFRSSMASEASSPTVGFRTVWNLPPQDR